MLALRNKRYSTVVHHECLPIVTRRGGHDSKHENDKNTTKKQHYCIIPHNTHHQTRKARKQPCAKRAASAPLSIPRHPLFVHAHVLCAPCTHKAANPTFAPTLAGPPTSTARLGHPSHHCNNQDRFQTLVAQSRKQKMFDAQTRENRARTHRATARLQINRIG